MNAFIIGAEQKKELALLKEIAEANPFSAAAMKERIKGTWQPGDDVLYTVYIPIDYKVVFTIETALERDNLEISHGMYRHLSVSIGSRKKTPHPAVVQEIMNELGFVHRLDSGQCQAWSEGQGIINVIEFISIK
jgi:hypothetical protein